MVVVIVVVVVVVFCSWLSIYLSFYLSIYIPIYLQARKRSYSARLPHCLKLTTSKTKQFCETSSFFSVDSIKNKAILRDFLQKWKVECRADGLVPMRFPIFQSICLNYCACHEKWCQVIRSAAPVTQNHLSKPEDLMLQNATPLRKSAPWPPNISDKHVPCTAPATENASLQILFKCPMPAIVFGNATKPSIFFCSPLENPLRLPSENTSEPSKVVRTCGAFNILTWKCASRHNDVHFFDISTSKSAPNPVSFSHFWLPNVLRATTACTFSTSQLPKVVRTWGVLYILTWKCASRHNGVQLFIVGSLTSKHPSIIFICIYVHK